MERKRPKTMAPGGIKRYWPVLVVGALLGAQTIWAQEAPTIDSLIISAEDAGVVDRDGFYNPAQQAVQFYLIYKGAVDADAVRGALKLQGQVPQNKRLDSLATWLSFGGTLLRRPKDEGWSAAIASLSLGTPVLNDGGVIQFSPKSGGTLFQVYGDSGVAPARASLAPNLRVTTIEADGDSLWVAGVFPSAGESAPRGFLALRDEGGKWELMGSPDFAGADTIQLSEALVTAIAASNQDIWLGTIQSGLLRFNKATKAWFQYTAERHRLAGNGIPVVAVEDDTTVWVGVKDSVQVRGLERVRLQGDAIAVTHFGGLPISRVPFPSLETKAKADPDPLPDFVQVLLVKKITVRDILPAASNDTTAIFSAFPSTLRVPNPQNPKADTIKVGFPRSLKALIAGSKTPGDIGSTQTVRIVPQVVTVNVGGSPVSVNFPPSTIDFPTGDTTPDSVETTLPAAVHFKVDTLGFDGIFLEPSGSLKLPGKAIQFPQQVKIGADSAEIFAEKGSIKVHVIGAQDTLVASSGMLIENPVRPLADPADFVLAPLPDSVRAIFNADTVWVRIDNPQLRVDGKTQNWPVNLRYQAVNQGERDSLFVPFPAVLRIPNPGEVGEPDFAVTKFQPPEDSIMVAIAIDPDTKDKWIGTGGSGLARLQVPADKGPESASWNILPGEGSLRSAIIFSIQIEKRGQKKYLWAGTDAGLLRLEIDEAVGRVLSDATLVDSLQAADSLATTAAARDAWLRLFPDSLQISASALQIFSAATSSIRTRGANLRAWAQSSLDTIRNNLVVFSPDNSPLPDKMVRDLALAGEDKWLATARGLVRLRDDNAGSVHHWQLFSAQHYGGRRDSLTAVEAKGDTIWLGRLPTWYSNISWSSAPTSMPPTLEKIGATAFFAGVEGDSVQALKGAFNLDTEPPTIRGLGPAISSGGDTTRIDSVVFPGGSEFFASVEDGGFGPEGIDSVKVYIDPSNADIPDSTSLVNSSRFHVTGGVSQRAYSVFQDSLIKTVWPKDKDSLFVVERVDGSSATLGKGTRTGNHVKVGNDSFPVFGDTLLPGKGRVFSVITDTLHAWRLRRHNFSFTAPVNLTPGRHNLVLEAVDRAGNTARKAIAFSVQDSGVVEASPVFLNYPNPFGKAGQPTLFYYALNKESEKVSLRVFDLSGVLVNILIRDEPRERGTYQEIWDGQDYFGQPLANGVYLCELAVGTEKRYTKVAIFR